MQDVCRREWEGGLIWTAKKKHTHTITALCRLFRHKKKGGEGEVEGITGKEDTDYERGVVVGGKCYWKRKGGNGGDESGEGEAKKEKKKKKKKKKKK